MLEPPERDFEAIKRRKQFVVEIPSRLPAHSRHATLTTTSTQSQPATSRPPPAAAAPPPPPPPPPAAVLPTGGADADPTNHHNHNQHAADPPPPPLANYPPCLTKHQEKVVNGLKHELDRLQPNKADTKEQGRKLRSQEATRFKSELSAYFPDYDEVIGNDPKEYHILNLDTPIILSDSKAIHPPPPSAQSSGAVPNNAPPASIPTYPVRGYGDNLFTDLFDSQRIDFSFLDSQHKGKSIGDPLPDSVFEPVHRKAERLERSIRNSEKGRAQHEKDQVIRLLDGLQGPDWLRVMGVSGITESKKKSFEPAREHFIKGCYAILEKFRTWAAEEKRRKLEKERAIAEARAENDSDDDESEEVDEVDQEISTESSDQPKVEEDGSGGESDGEPPDSGDIDASVAKQLREEALAAAVKTISRRGRGGRGSTPSLRHLPPEPEPYKEFTSFFRKAYQRDAALNKSRRRGRTVLAWGHPVPELVEGDFDLPEEFRDEDTLKSHARRRRRDKRGRH